MSRAALCIAAFAVALCALAAPGALAAPPDPAPDPAAIAPEARLDAEVVAAEPETQKPALDAAARTIIEAVNEKNPDKYVSVFADDAVVQIYQGPVRIVGREALRQNRAQHFERFPKAYSEIQHIVEIGSTVVMHDRVWLQGKSEGEPAEIVEIFTFKDGLIVRVEVIQPEGLLSRRAE